MSFIKLWYILKKNLLIVFRSWASILLLVLGPMILILIIGFAFNGDELHDIKMGAVTSNMTRAGPILTAFASENVTLVVYSTQEECISAMNQSSVHLCTVFSENFRLDPLTNQLKGTITFYYDNSRYNLIKFLLEYIKENIALTSEQISLGASEQIIQDVQSFVFFMGDTNRQLAQFKVDANQAKQDLIGMQTNLIVIKQDFDPTYAQIKELQEELNRTILTLQSVSYSQEEIETLQTTLTALDVLLENTQTFLTAAESTLLFASTQTNITVNVTTLNQTQETIEETQLVIEKTFVTINHTNEIINTTIEGILLVQTNIGLLVGKLDLVNSTITESLNAINTTLPKIDRGLSEIDILSAELTEKTTKLSGINQSDAQALIHPIDASYTPILGEVPKIQLIFPILLVFIIAFISILLSCMVVLNEIHSPAYFRNFLLPISNIYFIAGLFVTNMIVILLQVFVLLLVSYVNFAINIPPIFPQLFGAIIIVTTIFVLFGMFFAYSVRNKQNAILLSTFFALAIFLFSDVIFPIEIMPKIASFFASLNPLLIGENIFRKLIFFHIPLAEQISDLIILTSYIFLLALATIIAYYRNKMKT